jgi:hypothetical protein
VFEAAVRARLPEVKWLFVEPDLTPPAAAKPKSAGRAASTAR